MKHTNPLNLDNTWLKLKFLADHSKFIPLRFLERGSAIPVAARVLHMRVEHLGEQVVSEVVMHVAYLPGADLRLQVEQSRHCQSEDVRPPTRDVIVKTMLRDSVEELIEILALPPAVHVALAETQGTLVQDAVEEIGVFDADVPRTRTVDLVVCP